ncbi:MAG: class II glutamine amidotransferase [Thermoprotei archaeon]
MSVQVNPSGCGVFGVLRRRSAPKIKGESVVRAIERVRYRGSDKGAGFAVFNRDFGNRYVFKTFYQGDVNALKQVLEAMDVRAEEVKLKTLKPGVCDCEFQITLGNVTDGKKVFRTLNEILWKVNRRGRVYSVGTSLRVFKGVGYPSDVAKEYDVSSIEGDMWLAHTRQPTNSPGYLPYWSHPFSTFNVAIVHNGDVSSFGSNVEFLTERGWEGFVGTDSEVMAFLFEELISEGLSIEEAVKIMINPSRRLDPLKPEVDYLYRGARLDGPFTAVIGYDSGDDFYLIALADRSKFRPAVIGVDENYFFVASEENEIREVSPKATVWTLKPGSYFIASMNKGVIAHGRTQEEISTFAPPPAFVPEKYDIDASKYDYKSLNYAIAEVAKKKDEVVVANVMGHRYIGISFKRLGVSNKRIHLYGVVGNVLANLNENNEFWVHGNVGDDCCDTMHGGKVVILGDARDVLAQTFQNGKVFVKHNAGNRVGIQMREYKDRRPYLVIGGMVDDYLGEYMAGGVIVVLGRGVKGEPVGNFVGTGMVGGRIYIRGKVSPSKLGLQPNRVELMRLLKALAMENLISQELYDKLKDKDYTEIMDSLEGEAKKLARKMFEERIGVPRAEYRELSEEEFEELEPLMREYSNDVGFNALEILKEKFTVVTPRKE